MKITLTKDETISIIESYVKNTMNIQGEISTDATGNFVIETKLVSLTNKPEVKEIKEEPVKSEPEPEIEVELKELKEDKQEETKQENSVTEVLGDPHDTSSLFE